MEAVDLCTRRLLKDLQDIWTNPPPLCVCSAELVDNNLFEWIATICGPVDSVYEGGVFKLCLLFPRTYPIDPPRVQFLTTIYHCNVSQYTGYICLDILNSNWIPAYNVSSILLSIYSLLTDCNPNSAVESDIAQLYKTDRKLHDIKAREYTLLYALP